jgi:hypothetical protein
MMHGGHHKDGGHASGHKSYPKHLGKHHKSPPGPAEEDGYEGEPHQGGHGTSVNTAKPKLVAGNPTVVSHADEEKSIGEVPGIYAKKRLDRKRRPGGQSGI